MAPIKYLLAYIAVFALAIADPVILFIENQSVDEDDEITVEVRTINPENDSLSYTASAEQSWIQISAPIVIDDFIVNYIFTFDANANGNSTVTITASDSIGTDSVDFILTVNAVNDAPILNTISAQETSEEDDITVTLTASDVDIVTNGQSLSFSATSSDESMVMVSTSLTSDDSTATLTLDVQANANGEVTVSVIVSDGEGETDSQDFVLTITEENDPPTADAGISITTDEDTNGGTELTGNDGDSWTSDVDYQTLSYAIVDSTVHGILTLNEATGSVSYVPDLNYNGVDSFTFRVTDDGTTDGSPDPLTSASASVSITVNAVNDAPVVMAISEQIILEDSIFTTINLSDFVDDVETADTDLIWTYSGDVDLSVSITNQVVEMGVLASDWNGTEDILFTVTDTGDDGTESLSDTINVTFTVRPVNDAPLAMGQALLSAIDEDDTLSFGSSIYDLFISNFNDTQDETEGSSANTLAGIAIKGDTSVANQGHWQYSNDASWINIPSVSPENSFLLSETLFLRFNPHPDWNGIPGNLEAHLIDNSQGDINSGLTENMSIAIMDTAQYSFSSISLGTTINAVNDAPVITSVSLPEDTLIYSNIEGQKQVIVTLSFEDIDSENLQISYLDSGNVIDSYPILKSIDSTNIILDTLNYNFTHGEHEFTIIILDDGDNEDETVLLDTNIVQWDLAYPSIEFSETPLYVVSDTIRTLPNIQIINGQIDSSINQTNDIKLTLPDNSNFKWELIQEIDLLGSNLINAFPSISDSQRTITFIVNNDFVDGDTVTISNLRISQLDSVQGPTNLKIIIDGEGNYNAANAQTKKQITVGDSRVNFSNSDAYSVGDPNVIQSPSIIIWEESPYSVISKDNGIHLKIPSTLHCDWNDSTNWFNVEIINSSGGVTEILADSLRIDESILSIALTNDLASDDTVKISGPLFENFQNVSFPNSVLLSIAIPEPDQSYSFERSTENLLRIGDPTLISPVDHILIKDFDSLYSDTLMPVQIIEHDDVASITKEKGIILRLPENSGLTWDANEFNNIIKSDLIDEFIIHEDGEHLIQVNLSDNLLPGDTLTIRRLPVKNILNRVYDEHLDCSTNGNISFNRTDTKNLSIGQVGIFSEDRTFLLNDTTQAFPVSLIQDSFYKLIDQQYGVFLFIDEAFPVVFDSSQTEISYLYLDQSYVASIQHFSEKKIQIQFAQDIEPGETLLITDLMFSEFEEQFEWTNNIISLSVKDSFHPTFSDSTEKGIGKPNFESDSYWALTGSETSIEMPALTVKNDPSVGIITTDKTISFVLSENDPLFWGQVPLLDISGAYANINPEPIYSNDRKRISIQVTDDFLLEDSIIVNGLRVNVTGNVSGNLFLSLNETTFQDTIIAWVRSGNVSFNSSDQFFLKNVGPDKRMLSTIEIGQGGTVLIDSINDLILRLPLNSYFNWDDVQNQTPIYSFANNDSGVISDNIYISDDRKSIRLPVEYFPTNDTLFINGLRFAELTHTDSTNLILALDGEDNEMVLVDPAIKIIAGFELDYEKSWNFVLGDSGRFAVLPDINVVNDHYNTLQKTDIMLKLPDRRLTWDSTIQTVGIIHDSIQIDYDINRINDTILFIPSGIPISPNDTIKIVGLQLNTITDTMNFKHPDFIFSLSEDNRFKSEDNAIEVTSAVEIGIGNPTLSYNSEMSFGLNENLSKSISTITIAESSVPVFGAHRDLTVLSINGLNEKLIFKQEENWNISDPGFIKSVSTDSIIIGFSRDLLPSEEIQLTNITMSTELFFREGSYLDNNIISGEMKGAFGMSYQIEQDDREQMIDTGPDIELYPSLLFSEPTFYVVDSIYQLEAYLFPSIIDTEKTDFSSVMELTHLEKNGLFYNDLAGQYNNISVLSNQNYSFSDSLFVPFDKMIITLNPSIADTLNIYADLNRYNSIENKFTLNLNRTELSIESDIDTSGFRISRFEDNHGIDIGYSLDSIFLKPDNGILSNDAIDSLKLLLPRFPFARHLVIQDRDLAVVSDTIFTDESEDYIQLSGNFTKDGTYYVFLEGIMSDSSNTIPIKRQFRLDNTTPSFQFDSTDSLAIMLMSKGKGDFGHLVAINQLFEISFSDSNGMSSLRNSHPRYYFDDSLNISLKLIHSQTTETEYETNYRMDIEDNTSISMSFDSLLSFIMASEYDQLGKDEHHFEYVISVSDPAGNTNLIDLFFSVDLSGKILGDEFFNYPNPFSNLIHEKTKIRYVLLKEQTLGIFYIIDLGGDMVQVMELENTFLTTGSHEIQWNGRNMNGNLVSSGVYLGILKMDDSNKKIKIVIRN
ncbi:MAG: hypothetical protein HN601_01415 [Candidatus Marinimicrobia bacterium]|nr:hypothetical protein [Candidatus Neomarinimicrobiota bacterium]